MIYQKVEGDIMKKFVLTDYIEQAMALATYDKLEDGSFVGKIAPCQGVIAFGSTLRQCEEELRSSLEDWVLLGLILNHPLPVIEDIDLNREVRLEPMDTLQTT